MNPVNRNSTSIDEVIPISKVHLVDIPSASRTPSAQALPLNLPCRDLLDGSREEYLKICLPLYKASRKGDWKTAKDILDERKELVRFSITKNRETALHVAVSRGETDFVKKLVRLMEKEDLELQDNGSYTALCIAVRRHHVEMARILLQKNKALIDIPTSLGMMPLHMAASYERNAKMVKFLYKNSQSMGGNVWTPESRSCFLLACVEAEYFDVALKVLEDRPEQLALSGGGVLKLLAQKTEAFRLSFFKKRTPALKLLRSMLKNIAKLPWPEVYDLMKGPADPINKEKTATNPTDTPKKYSSRVLFLAAEVGNTVFIVEIIRQYPELLTDVNDINQSIFHVAISHRHEEIYSILFHIGSIKDHIINLEDENGNNMLHLVGIFTESARSNRYNYIPGPAQRMQKEQLLFRLVQHLLPLSFRKKKNAAGMTPHEEFIKHLHKDLVSDGEKWIKDASKQLIVVAALLATISFAATITFPGGYNQDKGYPILSRKKILFPSSIIFNSTAFLSASVSMIFALSLLTSRYDEVDFFLTLPRKLITTVATLLISILATIMAFTINLFLLFENSSPLLPKLFMGIIFIVLVFSVTQIIYLEKSLLFSTFIILLPPWNSLPSTRSRDQVLFLNI